MVACRGGDHEGVLQTQAVGVLRSQGSCLHCNLSVKLRDLDCQRVEHALHALPGHGQSVGADGAYEHLSER